MIEPKLDAPIPGMSLTHELGARPWQQPAQYTTIDEVIDYYVTRMASERSISRSWRNLNSVRHHQNQDWHRYPIRSECCSHACRLHSCYSTYLLEELLGKLAGRFENIM